MLVKRAVVHMVRDAVEAQGLTFKVVHEADSQGGRQLYEIDGKRYTPGEAADAFVPGGWAGTFGLGGSERGAL